MKKKLYHVLDVVSNRHWVVIAKSEDGARDKVLEKVPDLEVDSNPQENLEVDVAKCEDFTEIIAEIKVAW